MTTLHPLVKGDSKRSFVQHNSTERLVYDYRVCKLNFVSLQLGYNEWGLPNSNMREGLV